MGAYTEIYVDPSRQTRTACTITNSTTTATVTLNSHGYSNSDTVKIQGATETEYNGNFVISNVTTNTFDYTMASDPGGSATGSPLASKLNLSGVDGLSDANAYPDLQYALDNYTWDTANGNRINIKDSAEEITTARLEDPNMFFSNIAPIKFQGYTSTAGDGGWFTLNGGNGSHNVFEYTNRCSIRYAIIKNFGGGLTLGGTSYLYPNHYSDMEITDIGGVGVAGGVLERAWIHDIRASTQAVSGSYVYTVIRNCWISNCQNHNYAIYSTGGLTLTNTIITESGTDYVILHRSPQTTHIENISIDCAINGLSRGIGPATGYYPTWGSNILIESDGTGLAIQESNVAGAKLNTDTVSAYNVASLYSGTNNDKDSELENELLSGSPYQRNGTLPTDIKSASFWQDLYNYYRPRAIGSVLASNRPPRGAVAPASNNSAVTYSLHPLAYN